MIKTTVIGSYPKPNYVKVPTWFTKGTDRSTISDYNEYIKNNELNSYEILAGLKEILNEQDKLGIDIITDGEIRRENYIHYHLRYLDGIDFHNLSQITMRNGAHTFNAPTIINKIRPMKTFLGNEYKISKLFTNKEVKMTLPGPMTIMDSIGNNYYKNMEEALYDLSLCLNYEIKQLVSAGCKWIQIDEPVFARYPNDTIKYGIKYLNMCFSDIPDDVIKVVHICKGYPTKLNDFMYKKANKDAYHMIIEYLDKHCNINAISLEDAHDKNNLSLFSKVKTKGLIVGLVQIANSNIESVNSLVIRIQELLTVIPPNRLMIAPDCGCALLPRHICQQKLKNMVAAVHIINKKILK